MIFKKINKMYLYGLNVHLRTRTLRLPVGGEPLLAAFVDVSSVTDKMLQSMVIPRYLISTGSLLMEMWHWGVGVGHCFFNNLQ